MMRARRMRANPNDSQFTPQLRLWHGMRGADPLTLRPAICAGRFNPIDVRRLWLNKWIRMWSLCSIHLGTLPG
jgi:hypothetical protein